MSLTLTPLFESMVRQFRTIVSDDRFQKDFTHSVNLCLDELSFQADLATAMAHIENYDDTITGLDQKQTFILNDGLVVKLVESGYKHVRGDNAYNEALVNWNNRKADFWTMKVNEIQDDIETDGSGDSIAGLGDVTA